MKLMTDENYEERENSFNPDCCAADTSLQTTNWQNEKFSYLSWF